MDPVESTFKVESEGERDLHFVLPALANVLDRFVLVIGGNDEDCNPSRAVLRYTVATSQWESGPPLNQEREEASACSLGHSVYVFGGFDGADFLNCIERLDKAGTADLVN